jgi:hypothetical protein
MLTSFALGFAAVMRSSVAFIAPAKELKMLILVIIACTVLIIVCLGGGKKLAQIILGAVGLIGAIVLLGASGADKDIRPPQVTTFLVIVAVGAFFLLMFLRTRGVNWKITHMRHHDQDRDPQA